jgi:general secretion pathway protein D
MRSGDTRAEIDKHSAVLLNASTADARQQSEQATAGLDRCRAPSGWPFPVRTRRVALKFTALSRLGWMVKLAAAGALGGLLATATNAADPPPASGAGSAMKLAGLDAGQAMDAIDQASAALAAGQIEAAVAHWRQAASFAETTPEARGPVMQLREQLLKSGVASERLTPAQRGPGMPSSVQLPATLAAGMPQVAPSNVEAAREEMLRLLAIGRAALDRGDIALAMDAAQRAQALQVPEQALEPSMPRPWQLLLEAEAAARRMPGGVVQAAPGALPNGMVRQGGYNAQQDSTQNALAGALGPAAQSSGADLFRQGMAALEAGNRDEARRLFVEAWNQEGELDPLTRQQLREKLTLLQPEPVPVAPTQESPLAAVSQEAMLLRQRMFSEVTGELAAVNQQRAANPLAALDRLQSLRRRVAESGLDDAAKAQLSNMVERAIAGQQAYIEQNRAEIELNIQNDQVRRDLDAEARKRQEIDDRIAQLVDTFNELIDEHRYAEAELVAKQVREIDPGTPIATLMFTTSRMQTRIKQADEIYERKDVSFADSLRAVDDSSVPFNDMQPLAYGDAREWETLSRMRRDLAAQDRSPMGPVERALMQQLNMRVDVRFQDRPLAEVLDQLQQLTGVPIHLVESSLADVGIRRDQPVTLNLAQQVSLKSALQLILTPLDLSYVVQDEVVKVTSRTAQRAQVFPVAYKVADLVTPIPNFVSGYETGLAGNLAAAYQNLGRQLSVQTTPVSMVGRVANNGTPLQPGSMETGSQQVLAQYAQSNSPMLGLNGSPQMMPNGGFGGGGAQADFDSLMELIQSTIAPDSWEQLGGPGTMEPYFANLSLVISTTSDIHDQIADLLESLRELQNLQVTIEVRFITLSDNFFERIGVDFDFDIDDNVPAKSIRDDWGPSSVIGIGRDGLPTADFDISFNQNSFSSTVPQFGGFDVNSAATLGFAILSDIEAFFFIEAVQGDTRANVLQAPKVTLFDGQIGTITDSAFRPFVMSLIPVVGDFAVAQQPVIVVLSEGTQLNVQAVVSSDKRFVRLTLVPLFSRIGEVDTFTFDGSTTTRSGSVVIDPETGEPTADRNDVEVIRTGTTVQLPTFAVTSVSTTVSVPDGGTILLGGIKRLREQRIERGVPLLSKIPYVSRLFRNVGIGREASSLMLMVTPRIIIQEEEELAQTGYDSTR